MTAPDVRTAAQAEAEARADIARQLGSQYDSSDLVQGFVNGAVWGAALVTPTREQIAEAIAESGAYGYKWDQIPPLSKVAHLKSADAVLALMGRQAEGEG